MHLVSGPFPQMTHEVSLRLQISRVAGFLNLRDTQEQTAMKIDSFFLTDIGRKRQQNQDNGRCVPEKGLYIIADGMGGHRGGETASQMAVDLVCESIPDLNASLPLSPASRRTTLERAITTASRRIHDHASAHPELHGMGTTSTCVLITDQTAHIGQVGDSRCYLLRSQALWQLTLDHSWVQERLRAGLISSEQAENELQSSRNIITRSVGYEPKVEVDVFELPLLPKDLLLLCSDGLSNLIDKPQLESILNQGVSQGHTPEEIARKLIDLANQNGGDDNISALIIRVSPPTSPSLST